MPKGSVTRQTSVTCFFIGLSASNFLNQVWEGTSAGLAWIQSAMNILFSVYTDLRHDNAVLNKTVMDLHQRLAYEYHLKKDILVDMRLVLDKHDHNLQCTKDALIQTYSVAGVMKAGWALRADRIREALGPETCDMCAAVADTGSPLYRGHPGPCRQCQKEDRDPARCRACDIFTIDGGCRSVICPFYAGQLVGREDSIGDEADIGNSAQDRGPPDSGTGVRNRFHKRQRIMDAAEEFDDHREELSAMDTQADTQDDEGAMSERQRLLLDSVDHLYHSILHR